MIEEESWRLDGACLGADSDLFFPPKGQPTKPAKDICALCSVRGDCLEYALSNYIKVGIWGGLSERQRRDLRAKRLKEAA